MIFVIKCVYNLQPSELVFKNWMLKKAYLKIAIPRRFVNWQHISNVIGFHLFSVSGISKAANEESRQYL